MTGQAEKARMDSTTWNLMNETKQKLDSETEDRWVVARGGAWWDNCVLSGSATGTVPGTSVSARCGQHACVGVRCAGSAPSHHSGSRPGALERPGYLLSSPRAWGRVLAPLPWPRPQWPRPRDLWAGPLWPWLI